MHPGFSKWLDRWAMDLGASTVCVRSTGHERESVPGVFDLKQLDQPGRLPLDFMITQRGDFSFTSSTTTPWAENNQVRGKLIRAGRQWQDKPSVILIHGWNGERGYDYLFPYLGWRLARAGVNTAMLELPYHGTRKPTVAGAMTNFISDDIEGMKEAVIQAMGDVRSLMQWLHTQGTSRIGLWGFSLGAWLSGMVSSRDPLAKFVVLLTPVPDMAWAIRELPFCEPTRRTLAKRPVNLDDFNLCHQRPLAAEVLIIESEHDLFAPPETVEQLWKAWNYPDIWRVPHSHISVLMALPILERTIQWIADKGYPPHSTA